MSQLISMTCSIRANALSCFERVQQCFDAITQFVLKIFKQIGEFFYNLFHPSAKNQPKPDTLNQLENVKPVVLEVQPPLEVPAELNALLAFYSGQPNSNGLTFEQILNADNAYLEGNEEWLEWAFPLDKSSSPNAPLLDVQTFIQIRQDYLNKDNHSSITWNLLGADRRILLFYGITISPRGELVKSEDFAERAKNWLTPGNHNFKRIEHIIRSLSFLLPGHEKSFFRVMERIYLNEGKNIISEETYLLWKAASEIELLPIAPAEPNTLLAFFLGRPNNNGLSFEQIINADNGYLEENDEWLEWAFPLDKPTSPNAPVLDVLTFIQIRHDYLNKDNHSNITWNLLGGYQRILSFYGMTISPRGEIVKSEDFVERFKNWLTPGNHNFMRIERILRSLSFLLPVQAKGFLQGMENIYLNEGGNIIPEKIYQLWKNAIIV